VDKKKILVFSPSIVTTNAFFLESPVFASLANDFDLYICANTGSKGSDLKLFEHKGFKGIYGHSPSTKRVKTMLLELSVNALGGRKYSRNPGIIYNMCKESYGGKLKRMIHRSLGSTFTTAKWTNTVIEKYIGTDEKLQQIIDEVKPDAIVTFLCGGAALEIESIKTGKYNRIPVLGIQYGWDNISTWGLMPFLPDYIGVWGYQSRMFAEKIHRLDPERIFHIGAPFADRFRQSEDVSTSDVRRKLRLPTDKPVILFAGNIWAFDEVRNLKRLEDAIEKKELPDCCILYRPHPFQHYEGNDLDYFLQNFKHVYLDPMVEEQYTKAKAEKRDMKMDSVKVAIDFEHTKGIFSVVDGIIAPLSTIMIQGAVVGLPSVGIVYTDEANKRYRQRYDFEEFSIIKSMPGIHMALQPGDLVPACLKMLKFSRDKNNAELVKEYAGFAIQNDGLTVAGRLKQALEAIVLPQNGSLFAYMSQANRKVKLNTPDEVLDEVVAR